MNKSPLFELSHMTALSQVLTTDTECNQQNGLKEMLHGITHLVRNVTAHEVKIKWIVEEKEAIDILQTISFLHKYLDQCFVVPRIHS